MKIQNKPKIQLPLDMDEYCVDICNLLNRLPDTETSESCQGHGYQRSCIYFKCTNIDVITRLGRAVDKRYSDGIWELVVNTGDVNPKGGFLLRTNGVYDETTIKISIKELVDNIIYWFNDKFDSYFNS